jgi:hypothetical protein
MTTRDFITKAFYQTTKTRQCSSVFAENGSVYSYGYHYPLLFTVAGKAIRNVTGYSPSTNRHIQWSREVDAIDIHCLPSFRLVGSDESILSQLVKGQCQLIESIKETMQAKKRKNTAIYSDLERQLENAVSNLNQLIA